MTNIMRDSMFIGREKKLRVHRTEERQRRGMLRRGREKMNLERIGKNEEEKKELKRG